MEPALGTATLQQGCWHGGAPGICLLGSVVPILFPCRVGPRLYSPSGLTSRPCTQCPSLHPPFKGTYGAKATTGTQVFWVLVWVKHAYLELSDLAGGETPGF